MMNLTFVTVSTSGMNTMIKVYKEFRAKHPDMMNLNVFYAACELSDMKCEKMKKAIIDSDLVFIDLMGTPEDIVKDVYGALDKTEANVIPYGRSGRDYMKLGDLNAQSMKMGGGTKDKKPDMKAMQKMAGMAKKMGKVMPGKMRDMRNLSQITKYFTLADEYNIRNMFLLILREYGGFQNLPKPEEAREIPPIGICDPGGKKYFDTYEQYIKDFPNDTEKPLAAVLYYGHTYPNDTSKCVNEICVRLREFANVLPIAFASATVQEFDKLHTLLKEAAGEPVKMIVNFMSFRLGAGPMGGNTQEAINILEDIDAPYIHPFVMSRRRISEWMESVQGVSVSEFTISVMLPEFDGCMEALPVAAMCEPEYDPEFDMDLRELELIPERVEKLISRTEKLLSLKTKENKDKKLAVICYNYPPGEGNVFGGSFLDTFASIEKLLVDLKERGYITEEVPKEELIEKFTSGGIVNSGRYFQDDDSMAKYSAVKYKNTVEQRAYYEELINQWGDVPGNVMVTRRGDFLIPGVTFGNVFIGLQPSRGFGENSDKVYHDKKLLPHHQYLAYYEWLEKDFGADAVIHVGTHGTMEFAKGKECGMSGECFPDIMIGSMPHIYLYYAGNPSEAMIAKRRSHANIVSYQPAEYVKGDLYGEYEELNALIEELREAALKAPARCADIMDAVKEKALANNLPEEPDELEHELYRMSVSLIPKGLHTFGTGYDLVQAENYAREVIKRDRGDILSIRRITSCDMGLDYDELLEKNIHEKLSEIEEKSDFIIDFYLANNNIKGIDFNLEKSREDALKTLEYAKELIGVAAENHETSGLMGALDGRYNIAKLAGDIFRSPEVMPTGYNVYQFDPRRVPSPVAMQRGVKIAQNTIDAFKADNGQAPDSTAVILWGLETSRTEGETVAQILTYWGVRAVKSGSAWESKYEIIPLSALGRKRIDVVINMCGFFRDMFPKLLEDMNKLLIELSELDEPEDMNMIKANTKRIYEQLISEGTDSELACELSKSRIFGPAEGEYGTGITSIIETKNWKSEEQIGNAFIDSIRHVYSPKHRGMEAKELYTHNLEAVNLVSQIRSNNEYEVTDLDHYYEFFGGLAKSVEMVKGEKVKIYITDTTGAKIETDTAAKSVNRGIRTRLLNPKWIDGILAHDYHGAQQIADRFENVMGLAATTGEVEEWIYGDMHKTYIEDEDMVKRMKENNPYAYIEIIEQMLEYYNRGYWDATQEQLDRLKQVYLQVEGDIEDRIADRSDA